MKTAWLKLSALGLVGALAATACKITTGPDDGEGGTGGGSTSTGGKSGGTGGTVATGGMSTTGGKSSTGGTTSTGGKASTGGTTSTGGATATGGVLGCSNKGDKSTVIPDDCGFPSSSTSDPIIGDCLKCISKANTCCNQVKACFGTEPDNQCGWGGLEKTDPPETEFLCYQSCLIDKAKANGGQYDPDADTDFCANYCATPACGAPPVGNETNALIACMHLNCETECFVTPAM